MTLENKKNHNVKNIIQKLGRLHEKYKIGQREEESINARLERLEKFSVESGKTYSEFKTHLDEVNAKISK